MALSKRILILVVIASIVAVGIKIYYSNRIFHQRYNFENYQWQLTDTLVFNVDLDQTDIKEGFYFMFDLRYIHGYPYYYLPINIEIATPYDKVFENDFIIPVRDKEGNFLGEGMGDYWDLEYKSDLGTDIFNQEGMYKIMLFPSSESGEYLMLDELGMALYKKEKP